LEGRSFSEYECPLHWKHHGIKKIQKTKTITQSSKDQEVWIFSGFDDFHLRGYWRPLILTRDRLMFRKPV
jgi:hypothetical protein